MQNTPLFVMCAIAGFVPWGMIFKPVGIEAQLIGLVIQLIGLGVMFFNRKHIF